MKLQDKVRAVVEACERTNALPQTMYAELGHHIARQRMSGDYPSLVEQAAKQLAERGVVPDAVPAAEAIGAALAYYMG